MAKKAIKSEEMEKTTSKYAFRPLNADEIECRVGQCKNNGCSILLYKDARVDMRLLDEVFGPMNWQREHQVINNNLYCAVRVWSEEQQQWISKQDVGTESNTEAVKGETSDAFKRACFNWGIGRELYTAPFIWIPLDSKEVVVRNNGTASTYTKFTVKEIGYNEKREINKLVIVDASGKQRWPTAKANASTTATTTQSGLQAAIAELDKCKTRQEVIQVYNKHKEFHTNPEFMNKLKELGDKFPR